MDYIEYFVIFPAAAGIIWLAFKYAAWETFDDRRRSQRLVKRNLDRMCGR